jgi:hypothetical protein
MEIVGRHGDGYLEGEAGREDLRGEDENGLQRGKDRSVRSTRISSSKMQHPRG